MTLALFGGRPVRTKPFPAHTTIAEEEKKHVLEVLDSGLLSGFAARPGREFYGGPKVLALETAFQETFGVRHAVAFNSATSALHACMAAVGVGPGDEVITSPYTMSASGSCVLMQNAVPVFADIEPDQFCLDPDAVERAITSRTKAVLPVNLFGQPAALDAIMDLAGKRGLFVIEDNAQAPAARYRGRFAGTVGHLGVFSLNRHKTMQCGEGGVAVTNDSVLARRLQLIRNHGEVVAEDLGWPEDAQLVGYNYRMTELQAAVALGQIGKLEWLNRHRVELADQLSRQLSGCDFLTPPKVRSECTHVYYLFAMILRPDRLGVSRATLIKALQAEGIPVQGGYVKPLYRLALFRRGERDRTSCPVTEALHDETLLTTNVCRYPVTQDDIEDVVRAVGKIAVHRAQLVRHEQHAQAPARGALARGSL